jgi:hypothetical protein
MQKKQGNCQLSFQFSIQGYGLELIKKAIVDAIATPRAEDLTKASLPTYRQVPK